MSKQVRVIIFKKQKIALNCRLNGLTQTKFQKNYTPATYCKRSVVAEVTLSNNMKSNNMRSNRCVRLIKNEFINTNVKNKMYRYIKSNVCRIR